MKKLLRLTLLLLLWSTVSSFSQSLLPSPFHRALIDTARSYTWVRENYYHGRPINRSPIIDSWNRNMGLGVPKNPNTEGNYWCEIYVWNMVDKVCRAQHRRNLLEKTPSVAMQLRHANRIGSGLQVIRTKGLGIKLRMGDIFCIKDGKDYDTDIGKYWHGHTGFIDSVKTTRIVYTTEGNTNRAGSSNGDRVADRTRDYLTFLAVIRFN